MNIGVFGGSGFVGNYIVNELLDSNYKVTVLVRKESESKLSNSSKCNIVYGDIKNEKAIREVVEKSDAIIYNIGIIREFPSQNITFDELHYKGAKLVIDIAKDCNIERFVLMSANGVVPNGTGYQKTKYKAENYLKANIRDWTIIRPSLVFGNPLNCIEFCSQLKSDMLSLPFPAPSFFKGLNIFNAGKFKMSPVHVKDVSKVFVECITNNHSFKKIYHLGGESFTWNEIVKIISSSYGKPKLMIPAPSVGVYFAALLLDRFKWFPISRDQITMLLEGNECSSNDIFSRYKIKPILFNKENLSYLNDK